MVAPNRRCPNPECQELLDAWAIACPNRSWVECRECGEWFSLTPFQPVCPYCGWKSPAVSIGAGDSG
jgi:hypothetical protein